MGEETRRGYKSQYNGDKVDELLQQVDEKNIYPNATQEKHGLMGKNDKTKLDDIETITSYEIDALFN